MIFFYSTSLFYLPKKATDAIQTVNARYSYAPEHSGLRKQAVAVASKKAAAGHFALVKKQLRPHIGSLTLNKMYFYVGRLRPPIKSYSELLTD